jgi:hypothetical protein
MKEQQKILGISQEDQVISSGELKERNVDWGTLPTELRIASWSRKRHCPAVPTEMMAETMNDGITADGMRTIFDTTSLPWQIRIQEIAQGAI